MSLKSVCAFLVLVCLHSCISVSKQEVESSTQETPAFTHALARAASSSTFTAGDWPSENWWEIFNDPQLAVYIKTALQDSPTLQQADAKVDVAKQYAKQKRSTLFPEIDFNSYSNWQHLSRNGFFRAFAPTIPGNVDDTWFTLNLTYDLDIFGRNRLRYYSALSLYHAQAAERADVRLSLSAAVSKSYFELQADLERRALLKKTAQRRRSLLNLHEARKAHGLDTEIELLQADQNLLEIEKTLSINQESIELDDHLLRVLMGHSPDSANILDVLHIPFDGKIALPSDLSVNLLSRRPDLMARIWQVESAAKEVGAARADFYPDINLTALLGFESVFFHRLFNWPSSRAGSLNPAITLPIFTGDRLQSNLRGKWAEFHQATSAYHDTLLTAAREVVDQLTTLQRLDDQLRIQQLTVDNLRSQSDLSFLRYVEGVAAYLEALEREELLYNVELELVDLKLMQREAFVNLIKGLGGGYHSTPPLTPAKREASDG